MIEKIKNKRAFTLIEILAVIIILGVLLAMGVMTYNKIIEKSKEKAFFTNVNNIVNSIKTEQILDSSDYCMYNYSYDEENKVKNISSMYVIVHKEDDEIKYSVYAKMNDDNIIDIYDFKNAKYDSKSTWTSTGNEMSYTDFATKLFYGDYETLMTDYSVCSIGKDK